jgi:UDP-N-acetylmuramoyl-L-alanyl-D-glutamate--2,6-diaminopimelate ligase
MVKLSLATSELARLFGLGVSGSDVQVSGVSLSAQEVEPGDLFVAIQGAKHHGLDFLDQAVQQGAVAVLSDRPASALTSLFAEDPKALLGDICNAVLGKTQQRLFAVTGTNGKTSTSSYLFQILERLQQSPGLSGSTGMRIGNQSFPSPLTTAELTTTRKFLQKHAAQGGKTAVLEVSAQALIRHRVAGLEFEVAGFTNLSRDHLDDFASMQDYFNTKARLFEPEVCSRAVVFVGDDWSKTTCWKRSRN